jgi:hypothetical protein
MFMMTPKSTKFKRGFNFIKPFGVPLFEPLRTTQKLSKLKFMATIPCCLLGPNSYVSDDDKSIKSCLKFIRPSGVPPFPLFATIGATAECKIIEILIMMTYNNS